MSFQLCTDNREIKFPICHSCHKPKIPNLRIWQSPSDGHCFVHCLLRAINSEYDDDPTGEAKNFRRRMTDMLSKTSKRNGQTLYQNFGDGILSDLGDDYSLSKLQSRFDSSELLGDVEIQLISYVTAIKFYILHLETHKLYPYQIDPERKYRGSIIVLYYENGQHFDLCYSPSKFLFTDEDSEIKYLNSLT